MKFRKFPLPSYEIEEYVRERFSSKRSLAYGKRAVEKQKEKWGLFYDELAEFKSAEERQEKLIKKYIKLYRDRRKEEAEFWRKARKRYFALPKEMREKVKYVYEKAPTPNKPERLADYITFLEREPDKFEEYYKVILDLESKGLLDAEN